MISRRDLLRLSALVGLAPSRAPLAGDVPAPDFKIDIAPVTLDLSPRHCLTTTAYYGQVPGASAAPEEIGGIIKDVLLVDAQTRAEVEFTADNPGASLFHCHQQNHMDLGFMMLFEYA